MQQRFYLFYNNYVSVLYKNCKMYLQHLSMSYGFATRPSKDIFYHFYLVYIDDQSINGFRGKNIDE